MSKYKKSQCETLVRFKDDGTPVTKPKKQYETHDDAVKACERLNMMPHRIHKVVTYKCGVCHKYHIGRNGKEISNKYREKRTIRVNKNIHHYKVVGKIDLDKLK